MSEPTGVPTRWDENGGRSKLTALVRLIAAGWLLWTAGEAISNPPGVAAARGIGVELLLVLAGLSFSVGLFLATGFMSRICGLALAILAAWEMSATGVGATGLVLVFVGLYLMLRGGGAWGMDVYVQQMQDRVRQREAREKALKEQAEREAVGATSPGANASGAASGS